MLLFDALNPLANKNISIRKFFGQPNGTKDPPAQSKLAFSTKAKLNDESLKKESVKQEGDQMEVDQGEVESEGTRTSNGEIENNGDQAARQDQNGMFPGGFSRRITDSGFLRLSHGSKLCQSSIICHVHITANKSQKRC
jgi:hypothetical protein